MKYLNLICLLYLALILAVMAALFVIRRKVLMAINYREKYLSSNHRINGWYYVFNILISLVLLSSLCVPVMFAPSGALIKILSTLIYIMGILWVCVITIFKKDKFYFLIEDSHIEFSVQDIFTEPVKANINYNDISSVNVNKHSFDIVSKNSHPVRVYKRSIISFIGYNWILIKLDALANSKE